ncbi:hypothetical protein Ndes2526A_g00106 [Nannochloris sp. 'desiccata']
MATTARALEEKLAEGQPKGFPFEDFDVMDVMLPENDDMGIPSDDEEEEEEIQVESGLGNIVVVDNLPQVPQEKYEKLTAILRKIVSASGQVSEDGLHHPMDAASGLSKGFAFVEYETQEQARAAQKALDGYQLDKSHKFVAILFDDFDRLKTVPETYVEPEPRPFEAPGDLGDWLSDRRGRDQFCVRYSDEAEILWNDAAKQEPERVYERSFWTEAPFLVWSPRGTFVATLHRQGAAVWGGPDFRRIQRYAHANAQQVAFSPCERYLYTFSEIPPEPRSPPGYVLSVFEVRSGRLLRTFEGPQTEHAVGAAARSDGGMAWPSYKWSGGLAEDGSGPFIASMKQGAISVYSAPDMGLLDKKSIKAEGVHAFEWSPSDAVLCAYQEEKGNLPARVVLVQIPNKEELRAKNLFSVADVRMAWHPQGDYLAIRVEKWTKTRKSTTTNLEIFSMRQRNVPVDMLELPNKTEKILGVAWEPHGHRFAVLHGDPARPSVSLYTMKDPKTGAIGGTHHLHTMPNRNATSLHWSPAGRFLLLAGTKAGHNGKLEWWDVDELAVIGAGEHFMATEVAWDPTGRYVATAVTAVNQMENGYMIWSFSGQLKELAKNLKQYSKRYEEEDEKLLAAADSEFLAERERMVNAWREWRAAKDAWVAEQQKGTAALFGSKWKDPESEYRVEKVEVTAVVDIKEEPAKGLN